MPLNLTKKSKTFLKKSLSEVLDKAVITGGVFLSNETLGDFFALEKTLPDAGKAWIEVGVDEDSFSDFVCEYLYDLMRPFSNMDFLAQDKLFKEISGLPGINQIADEIVELFDTLPWTYVTTFGVGDLLGPLFSNINIDVCDDIKLIAAGSDVFSGFDFGSGNVGFDNKNRGLLYNPSYSEDKNRIFVQVCSTGFSPQFSQGLVRQQAVDTFKAFIGAAIALGVFKLSDDRRGYLGRLKYFTHLNMESWILSGDADFDELVSNAIGRLCLSNRVSQNFKLKSTDETVEKILINISLIGILLSSKSESERLRKACKWYFDSFIEGDELLSFIQTMIALEILLGDYKASKKVGVTRLLGNRCAYFIADSHNETRSILSKFEEIYDIRSLIVHQGKHRLSSDERDLLRELRDFVGRVILKELKMINSAGR